MGLRSPWTRFRGGGGEFERSQPWERSKVAFLAHYTTSIHFISTQLLIARAARCRSLVRPGVEIAKSCW